MTRTFLLNDDGKLETQFVLDQVNEVPIKDTIYYAEIIWRPFSFKRWHISIRYHFGPFAPRVAFAKFRHETDAIHYVEGWKP